jgi:preprotein translocase subunit SecG
MTARGGIVAGRPPVVAGGMAAGRVAVMELTLQIILVVTSVLVVLLVLLHRAKGGGLSTLFGGGVQSSLSGSTVVEKNLDRLTLFVTGIWLVAIIGMALRIKYNL